MYIGLLLFRLQIADNLLKPTRGNFFECYLTLDDFVVAKPRTGELSFGILALIFRLQLAMILLTILNAPYSRNYFREKDLQKIYSLFSGHSFTSLFAKFFLLCSEAI